jgi:hypothetical protein
VYIYSTYHLLYIYSIPPDDGLQICPKHVECDLRNKLRIGGARVGFYYTDLSRCTVNKTYTRSHFPSLMPGLLLELYWSRLHCQTVTI